MKKLSGQKLFIIVLVGFALFSLALIYYFNSSPPVSRQSENVPVFPNEKEKISFGLPVRIRIPIINIDSIIEYVGLTPDGAMDVPEGPREVAWFELGPRPGEIGSSVVSGHSGWKDNISAVFDDLYKLEEGDKVYIEDEKGVIISFIVREIRKYDPEADASNVFGSNDGKSHLNLVTCTGVWDTVKKSRSERLVVFTDREV